MMDSGSKVKNMDREHIFVIMGLYLEDISSKGKDMDLVPSISMMELKFKPGGRLIVSKGKVKYSIIMEIISKDLSTTVKNKDKVSTVGIAILNIKAVSVGI